MVVSGHSTTARSWPDPNWNNRWPGVGPRYFPINIPVPQRLVPVGAGQWGLGGGKTAAGTGQNPRAPKRGSAKSGLTRGYRLTFAMTGLGWGDLSQCCDATKKIQELFF